MKKVVALVSTIFIALQPFYAAAKTEKIDFSDYKVGLPGGFDKWSSGVSLFANPKPSLSAAQGIFGNDETLTSAIIETEDGTDVSAVPSLSKNLTFKTSATIHARIAAGDTNSLKSFCVTAVNGKTLNVVEFLPTGKIGAFGNEIINYETKKWYDFDILINADKGTVSVYESGAALLKDEICADITNGIAAISFGFSEPFGKTAFAIDCLYIDDSDVIAQRSTEIKNPDYEIIGGYVKNIPSDITKEQFISSLNIPDGAVCSIEGEFTSGAVAEIISADGINRKKYILLMKTDVMLEIIPDSVELGEGVTLSADVNTKPDYVLFLNGDEEIARVYNPPYKYYFKPGAAGEFKIRAAAVMGDIKFYSEERKLTVLNDKISVTISDIPQSIAFGEELSVTVSAINGSKSELYLDGTKYAESEEENPVFVLSDIACGRHEIYAVAYNTDGKSGKSRSVQFFVIQKSEENIYFEDFENRGSEVWKLYNSESTKDYGYKKYDEEHGMSFYAEPEGSTTPYYACTTSFAQMLQKDTVIMECDILMTAKTVSVKLFELKSAGSPTLWNIDAQINSSKIQGAEKGIDYNIGQWYHIKYVFNLSDKFSELYADGEFLGRNEKLNTDGTLYDIRFDLGGYGGAAVYIDNIKVSTESETAYIKSLAFEKDGVKSSTAVFGTDRIIVPFSKAVMKEDINPENIKLTRDNMQVKIKNMFYDAETKSAVLELEKPLRSSKTYKVTLSENIRTAAGIKLPAELSVLFAADEKDFDILSASALSGNDNKLSFCAEVQNTSSESKEALLIFVAYKDSVMKYYDMQNITVEAGEKKVFYSSSDYSAEDMPDFAECYLWQDDKTFKSLAAPQKILFK